MADLSFFLSPTALGATLTSFLLVGLDLLIALRNTVWAKRPLPGWTQFLPLLALGLMVAQVAANLNFNFAFVLMSAPIYLATFVIAGAALVRASLGLVRWLRRRSQPVRPPRLNLALAGLAVVCTALVLLGTLRLTQTYVYAYSMVSRIHLLDGAPGGADFSEQRWSQAFAGLVERLKVQYPFTAWKMIDWDRLNAEFAPRIAAAERQNDAKAYYRTLREFAWRIPDGHVGLNGDDRGLKRAEVGGSYGLTLLRLDDGRLVVRALLPASSAAQTGIKIGAEITAWNGTTVEQALAQTPILWSEAPPATQEGRQLQQVRFLNRGPVGSQVTVTFRNRDEQNVRTAILTASPSELDGHGDLGPAGLVTRAVTGRVLPSGYGYIRVVNEMPSLAGFPDAQMRQVVVSLAAQAVPGMIVDVRDNLGGESKLTANMLAAFQPEARLYQYLGLLDPASQRFQPATDAPLWIQPASRQYRGPVAVLIDEYSHSAAEDLALILQELPNGFVVGINGTAGAGGSSEVDVQLPGGYTFMFPKAQSLDANFQIQIESDHNGHGGVSPDIRIPLNEATLDGLSAGRDVVLERAEDALREQTAARQ